MPQFTSTPLYQRRNLPRSLKAAVWNMTWGHCWYCGTNYMNPFETFVIEHVVPLSRGGADEIENLVPACVDCNQAKGTLLLEEWRAARPLGDDPDEYPYLREYPDPNGLGVLTGRFWFERDESMQWEWHRQMEIQVFRRMEKRQREGSW